MCGIAGWLRGPLRHLDFERLEAMNDSLIHRGPDGQGSHITESSGGYQIALGHRRLSIIDLETGAQPMQDEGGRITVVFNGEIYNFQDLREQLSDAGYPFRTSSDTEVLVNGYLHWGESLVEHLRGQFAFAIWDSVDENLFLARDRFGLKPLFLFERCGDIHFASEAKALFTLPNISPEIDLAAVQTYLRFRYVPGPNTLFKGVVKLPPGHAARWKSGVFETWQYYTPPDASARSPKPLPKDPIGGFLDILEESVRIRMVADVPYGAFLSGGIDSSAVVGLMSRHSEHPVQTFSVGFDDAEYSELGYAKQVAGIFECEHHELVVEPDDMIDHLQGLIRYRDAPVAEPSDIPIYLLAKEAGKSVKMVLTGEGADEFLGGYEKHLLEGVARWYRLLCPSPIHDWLVSPIIHSLPYGSHKAKTAISSVGLLDHKDRYPRWFGALSMRDLNRLSSLEKTRDVGDGVCFQNGAGNSLLRRLLHFDQSSWLPDNLLERGDRMSMAASIEGRLPFMDHRLAEYVSALPDNFRVRGRTTKWILRQAMQRLLPAEILNRPKVGFRVPVNDWFRGPLKDWIRELLLESGSKTTGYYHKKRLAKVIDDHTGGRHNHEKLLWTMLNLELVHREYSL